MCQSKVNSVIEQLSILAIVLCILQSSATNGAVLRTDDLSQPSEVLEIQPVLIYPKPRENLYQARNIDNDEDDIIYVKLLSNHKSAYRPKPHQQREENSLVPHEINMKDIFYVKALTNGAFSHRRLKVFQLPEFYALNVFHTDTK